MAKAICRKVDSGMMATSAKVAARMAPAVVMACEVRGTALDQRLGERPSPGLVPDRADGEDVVVRPEGDQQHGGGEGGVEGQSLLAEDVLEEPGGEPERGRDAEHAAGEQGDRGERARAGRGRESAARPPGRPRRVICRLSRVSWATSEAMRVCPVSATLRLGQTGLTGESGQPLLQVPDVVDGLCGERVAVVDDDEAGGVPALGQYQTAWPGRRGQVGGAEHPGDAGLTRRSPLPAGASAAGSSTTPSCSTRTSVGAVMPRRPASARSCGALGDPVVARQPGGEGEVEPRRRQRDARQAEDQDHGGRGDQRGAAAGEQVDDPGEPAGSAWRNDLDDGALARSDPRTGSTVNSRQLAIVITAGVEGQAEGQADERRSGPAPGRGRGRSRTVPRAGRSCRRPRSARPPRSPSPSRRSARPRRCHDVVGVVVELVAEGGEEQDAVVGDDAEEQGEQDRFELSGHLEAERAASRSSSGK